MVALPPVLCPECGAAMKLRETKRFVHKDGTPRKFWGCTNWPYCNGIHGAHPNGRPLGIPANKETKAARIRAHAVFDTLWKDGRASRAWAYGIMRRLMDLDKDHAHISMFDLEQCEEFLKRFTEWDAQGRPNLKEAEATTHEQRR